MGNETMVVIADRENLPELWPTHMHSAKFWEQLGRTIAAFGHLEYVLSRAIFAFTATREFSADEIELYFDEWIKTLERALSDTLVRLAESYKKAVQKHQTANSDTTQDLVDKIKILRNTEMRSAMGAGNAQI